MRCKATPSKRPLELDKKVTKLGALGASDDLRLGTCDIFSGGGSKWQELQGRTGTEIPGPAPIDSKSGGHSSPTEIVSIYYPYEQSLRHPEVFRGPWQLLRSLESLSERQRASEGLREHQKAPKCIRGSWARGGASEGGASGGGGISVNPCSFDLPAKQINQSRYFRRRTAWRLFFPSDFSPLT